LLSTAWPMLSRGPVQQAMKITCSSQPLIVARHADDCEPCERPVSDLGKGFMPSYLLTIKKA
jgi:hypothetical protein